MLHQERLHLGSPHRARSDAPEQKDDHDQRVVEQRGTTARRVERPGEVCRLVGQPVTDEETTVPESCVVSAAVSHDREVLDERNEDRLG